MSVLAIATATRAEYGLLKPFIASLKRQGVETRIVVTGMHLSPSFGSTCQEIEADGFEIDRRIQILVDSDSPAGVSKTMSLALSGFADYFSDRRPDALLVLGDRYETLSICAAAANERIPIFHLYGGETTEGALDEAYRHCITKMSYLHFTSTEAYRRRVIQLGEHPSRVFNVGAVGIENVMNTELLDGVQIRQELGLDPHDTYAVLTYHPATLDEGDSSVEIEGVLNIVAERDDIQFIATKANADAGGRAINEVMEAFAAAHDNFSVFDSLGSLRYLSALAHAQFVIGNSSSGILEAPAFGTPTINIGVRQLGRIRPVSVVDCANDAESIKDAMREVVSDGFRDRMEGAINPYGDGDVSSKVTDIVTRALQCKIDLKKKFYDIGSFDCD